jgi:RimJ/RimL family protein N-acetyltransferase
MKNEKLISLLPLETDRLIIKATSTDDIDLLLKIDKQEVSQKFLGGIKNKTREERIAFLEKKEKKFADNIVGSLTVCLKDETPIGFIGVDINEKDSNAEISYLFDSDYTGHGYCYETCYKLIEISFKILGLEKVYANTISGNIGSIRVLEKLGFKHEGTRRKHVFVETLNEYRDFLYYGLLKEEFKI